MARYVSGVATAVAVVTALQGSTVAAQSSMEEVIVTAQRREESLSKTPVSVSVLNTATLERQAITSQADLQLAVPGLLVKAGQNSNQLNYAIRGQTVDAFSSSRPAVLPYFNEVQVGGSAASAFYDLASIQVLKGPQGTLFGRNSTGGAVLFTTAKPTNEFGGFITGWLGNYSDRKAEGAVNAPLVADKLLARVSGFYQKRDGYQKNHFDGSTHGDVDRKNARLSLTATPTDAITNELVVDYARSKGNSLSSVVYNVLPAGAPSFVPTPFLYSPAVDALAPGAWNAYLAAHPGADPDGLTAFVQKQQKGNPFDISVDGPNIFDLKNVIVSNISSVEINDDMRVRNIIGYTDIKTQIASEFDGTVFSIDDGGPTGRDGELEQFSEELQVAGEAFDKKLAYVAGLYYSKETDNTYSRSDIVGLEPIIPTTVQINNGRTTNKTNAIYGQGTLDISDWTGIEDLSFTLGLRYSKEKIEFLHKADDVYIANPAPVGAVFVNPLKDEFGQVSWTVGLQKQVNNELMVYLSSRRGYRSGGFNYFAPPLPGFGNDGGAEYDEEKATDIELGAKYDGALGDMPVRLNAAVYGMRFENIQRSNYVQIFGSLAGITVNVPESEVKGFELDGAVNPVDWLSLGGSVNYTDAEFTKNSVSVLGNPAVAFGPYPDSPKWSGTLFAEVTVPVADGLTGSLRADLYSQTSSYFSSTNDTLNPGTKIDGYSVTNLRAGIADENAGWEVAAYVKNVFDKTYYVGGIGFASLFAVNTVIPGAPRTYMLEARYKF